MIPTIHPFPARMAPELALESLGTLRKGSVVLDPMAGSGTVLRHAAQLGHTAIGFDMDPLAILMSRVWTSPVADATVQHVYDAIIQTALALDPAQVRLPWIDDDVETSEFVSYWFGATQIRDLRCLAFALHEVESRELAGDVRLAVDVLRLALSRIIITKEQCASLARDTSHSRPHRVAVASEYEVFAGFHRSLNFIRKRLTGTPPTGVASVSAGDARSIDLEDGSIDAVLTSPPYLNAIDYMRGHRLSLVWLGHRLSDLRSIRSASIGAERGLEQAADACATLKAEMGIFDKLPPRQVSMIERYAYDIWQMVSEVSRVLRKSGRATFVVGNSCLKGVFIHNSNAVCKAAQISGLTLIRSYERDLPARNRYLPVSPDGALGKRMRTETIVTFGA